MNTKIQSLLTQKKILVGDGAWGTLLQQAGLKAGDCPEKWNIEKRDVVLQTARSYAELGIDLLESNSFGGSSFKLEPFGLAPRAYVLNRTAAEISVEARQEGQIVMASMGPTGKILMMGEISEDQIYEAFAEQARGLEDGGADAVILETMTDMDEARVAIRAVRENTQLELVCSFTFSKTATGEYRTMMGLSPTRVAEELISLEIPIIGVNCGSGLGDMIPVLDEMSAVDRNIPLLVNANAGMPEIKDGKTVYADSPEKMASLVKEVVSSGARIIGGCCGTTPDHIRAMIHEIDRLS